MAPFYSRYTPTSNVSTVKSAHAVPASPSKKRKLENEETEFRQEPKKSKKKVHGRPEDSQKEVKEIRTDGSQRSFDPEKTGPKALSPDIEKAEQLTRVVRGEGNSEHPPREKHSESKHKRAHHGARSSDMPEANGKVNGKEVEGEAGDQPDISEVKKKKRKREVDVAATGSEEDQGNATKSDQHASMRSKFEKATKKSADTLPNSEDGIGQKQSAYPPSEQVHGLEPLPQPPQVLKRVERPTFSSLPPWLSNPLRVNSTQSAHFSDLGLDLAMLENIKKQGFKTAFPVQSAVLPLLMDGQRRHQGDICISAATGSGKTLAYVLPIIQKLRCLATTKLRGLIVVPTRELVRQAREVCEIWAAGTNVKIATALGSKSLHDEQELLVERYEIYDPQEYDRQQSGQVDWSKTNLAAILSDLDKEEQPAPNFVPKYRSKVDVLICTPGRLVDHIRSTKGFTLDDVQWLVIDEADRLLNESFQEWTDIVIPALQIRDSHALQDQVLRHMRLAVPERVVQKVILSATLTQDISKLNSLKLRNPKLVVVGDVNPPLTEAIDESAVEPQADEGGSFDLPTTLTEYAIAVGDGSDKPLYLLELLRTKVNVFNLQSSKEHKSVDDQDSNGSSASETSDSDSESTSSQSTSSDTLSASLIRKSKPLSSTQDNQPTNNTALIFTRSTESATRLTRLLSLLSAPISSLTTTLTKSSSTSSSTRKALLNFRQHRIRIIIATDRASRGLDLPGLGHVISYDVPTSMTTYVHRVGRTARAGRAGSAWTLVAHREARWFWREIGRGEGEMGRIVRSGKVKRDSLRVETRKDDGMRERYEKALKMLGEEVVGRGNGGGEVAV